VDTITVEDEGQLQWKIKNKCVKNKMVHTMY